MSGAQRAVGDRPLRRAAPPLYVRRCSRRADRTGERRTIHLGVDLFAPPGTAVLAPLRASVHAFADNAAPLDYGPVIILQHETDERDAFFTLYGHLSRESLAGLNRRPGASSAGDAVRGDRRRRRERRLDAAPALPADHRPARSGRGFSRRRAARRRRRRLAGALARSRTCSLRIPDDVASRREALDDGARRRRRGAQRGSAPTSAVAIASRSRVVRGWMQYLFDDDGRRYLDATTTSRTSATAIRASSDAAAGAAARRSTRTRATCTTSLARSRRALTRDAAGAAERLLLRQLRQRGQRAGAAAGARAHGAARPDRARRARITATRRRSSTSARTSSTARAGRARRRGCTSRRCRTSIAARYTARDRGRRRAVRAHVADAIDRRCRARRPAHLRAFIAETLPERRRPDRPAARLPRERLRARPRGRRRVHRRRSADRRTAGWARTSGRFEAQGVVPDIVVLGKPIGNGYPLGAVVTTPEIAASFDNGMEFFSTFGGNTVSCAVGLAVLDVRAGARAAGARAATSASACSPGCDALADRHAIVGDVRGSGLFLGVELVATATRSSRRAARRRYVVEPHARRGHPASAPTGRSTTSSRSVRRCRSSPRMRTCWWRARSRAERAGIAGLPRRLRAQHAHLDQQPGEVEDPALVDDQVVLESGR